MVRVILLTLVFAAVCSFLNVSPTSVQYRPQRPSSLRSKRRAATVMPRSEAILFPEDEKTVDSRQALPPPTPYKSNKPPPCANGSTYCETVEGYPLDHVTNLLTQDVSMLQGFFGLDTMIPDDVQNRIDPSGGERLCFTKEEQIFPKMAQNKEDVWLYIVNQDKYVQGVRIEKCLSHGKECAFSSSFPAGYRTECKQKYIYRKLLAVNDTGVVREDFLFPSCCICVYRPPDLSSRMGVPEPLAQTTPTNNTCSTC